MQVKANGIDIHYEIRGSGPWLTLSHSLAADASMWAPQIEEFSRRYTVLAYDTRGHGRTSAPAGAYTLDMLADDLKGLLDALGIASTHYCGLSMGGMIGQTFALRHPGRLASLALADTTSRYPPEAATLWAARVQTATTQGMAPLVEPTLGRWFTDPFRADPANAALLDRVRGMILGTPVAGYAGCCQALPLINLTARLREIRTPILVICGEQDLGTPPAMAREIHQNAPGSELVLLPSAAHIANLEQPARFNQALAAFLERCAAGAPR